MIVSCASTKLSADEKALFKDLQPWGIIFFARNLSHKAQIINLVEELKHSMDRDNLLVFIDQEGGRVSRLPKEHFRVPPSPTTFAELYFRDQTKAKRACYLNALLTGIELKSLGINVNCAPMLDLPQIDADPIVTERALGNQPSQVIDLAQEIINGYKQAKVAPVIKHMPGHGRAKSDSHKTLPVVTASKQSLNDWDFLPFKAFANECMAMTAHIVFQQIDGTVATQSSVLIEQIMRKAIGFNGILMTDDINMNALKGSISDRASASLNAGCDLVLHCSGELNEMKELLDVCTLLRGESLNRAKTVEEIAFARLPELDEQTIKAELDDILNANML